MESEKYLTTEKEGRKVGKEKQQRTNGTNRKRLDSNQTTSVMTKCSWS